VQYLFAKLYGAQYWERTVSEEGFFAVYNQLFGYPFDYAQEPLLPPDLEQPVMGLPFEEGVAWSFSGGPHGGWADGSAWAALDFGPPGDVNCVPNDAWVIAMADGPVVRAENGAVVQDLDGDGNEQTGWTILYMHIESRDRVQTGTQLQAGAQVGHPSCEGGFTNGTHVHIARRYNGEWIPADQGLPFNMDGWISSGTGNVYQGYLSKDGITLTADEFRISDNVFPPP
jgi:murein DD-endopeptidase MepM/ murein hydrolase activator NlpD